MLQPQTLRPVCTYSLQNHWPLVEGHGPAVNSLAHPSMRRWLPGDSLPMSKPSYFSSMGGVFLVLKIISSSNSLCVYTMLLLLLCPPATLTSSLSVLNASFFLSTWQGPHQHRLWRDWEEMGCVFFACDTLFPFTSKQFLQCCLLGTCCCSGLKLSWLLGLGSCTALIQFTTQLYNCSPSPLDLDVKQRSSCTSPEKEGGISGQSLRTFSLGFWNGMWHRKAKPDQ